MYCLSAATLASDPRHYIYGILGVTHAFMDRLTTLQDGNSETTYSPIKADYRLSVAQVFQNFIIRLMRGAVGVRAIALIQPGPKWEFQDRRRSPNSPDLPSWVPDLADRDRFALSNDGIVNHGRVAAMNVIAPHTPNQRFSIHGRDLHVHDRLKCSIQKSSRPFPYDSDLK